MDTASDAVDRIGAAHYEAGLTLARSVGLLRDLQEVEEQRHPTPDRVAPHPPTR